jgi:hypothetical protein
MKIACLFVFAAGLIGGLHGQEASAQAPAATPVPLPPGPWIKRAPVPSQWVVSYAEKSKANSPAGNVPPDTGAKKTTPADPTARSTVSVSKAADLLVEVTKRQNGAVVSRWRSGGRFFTQVGGAGPWFVSATGADSGFSETDYSKTDFPGFDWISEKNYVGARTVGDRQYFVFRDKVVTLDPQDIEALEKAAGQAIANWQDKQLESSAKGNSPAKPKAPATVPPRPFNIDDYKMDAEAVVDSDSGLPVTLSYGTTLGNETRTYQFLPPPSTPLSLPPEAQQIAGEQQASLRRASRPASVP